MYPELIHCTLIGLKALQGLSVLHCGCEYDAQLPKGTTGNKATRKLLSIQPRATTQSPKDRDFSPPFPLQFSSLLLTVIICTLDVCRTLRAVKSWGAPTLTFFLQISDGTTRTRQKKGPAGEGCTHEPAEGGEELLLFCSFLQLLDSDSVTEKTPNCFWNFDHIFFMALSSVISSGASTPTKKMPELCWKQLKDNHHLQDGWQPLAPLLHPTLFHLCLTSKQHFQTCPSWTFTLSVSLNSFLLIRGCFTAFQVIDCAFAGQYHSPHCINGILLPSLAYDGKI